MLALHDRLAEVRARREEGEKGFTLIELLVVVIIIGILAAIAIPIFLGQQDSARDSAVQSDLRNAKTAIVAFQVDNPGATSVTIPGNLAAFDPTSDIAGYGLTVSEFTTFSPTDVTLRNADGSANNWVLTGTSTTGASFTVSANGGVEPVDTTP